MKRLLILLSVALLVLAGMTMGVLADDEQSCVVNTAGQIQCQPDGQGGGENSTCTTDPDDNSNLPECGTHADNECNPGGTMAGRCESSAANWQCGWFIARFNNGVFTREQVPDWCTHLLPPLPDEVTVPTSEPPANTLCIVTVNETQYVVPTVVLNGGETNDFFWSFGDSGHVIELNAEAVYIWNDSQGWVFPVTGPCAVTLPPEEPDPGEGAS